MSEFTWNLLEDENIYNMMVSDKSIVQLSNSSTKSSKSTYREDPNPSPLDFDFDIDREGGFLGLPNEDEVTNRFYLALGVE